MGRCGSNGSSVIQLFAKSAFKRSPIFLLCLVEMQLQTLDTLQYLGTGTWETEDLILDLEIMPNIYQCQIINLQLARHRALKLKVGDTQHSLKMDLAVGDLVLIRGPLQAKHSCQNIKLISE